MAGKRKHRTPYELVKLPLSGRKCSFYTVYLTDEKTTLFDKFIEDNETDHPEALDDILDRIELYANKFGALDKDFRFEGSKIGEFAHALRDYPDQRLRLYCVRYGMNLVILGGGGPKKVAAWQQDKFLSSQVEFMIQVADDIHERLLDGEIRFSNGQFDLEGNLNFEFYDE